MYQYDLMVKVWHTCSSFAVGSVEGQQVNTSRQEPGKDYTQLQNYRRPQLQ